MGDVIIGSAPYQLTTPYTKAISGENVGSSTIYFKTDSGVSPTNRDSQVGPGQPFTISAAVTTYVCTDSGATSELIYSDAVTGSSIGSVNTLASTVPTLIDTQNVTLTNAFAGQTPVGYFNRAVPVASLKMYDVSAYSSLIVTIKSLAGPNSQATYNVNNFLDCYLFQNPSIPVTTSLISDATRAQWLLMSGQSADVMKIQVPVVAQYANLSVIVTQGVAGLGGGLVTVSLYGSHEVVTRKKYINGNPFTALVNGAPSGTAAIMGSAVLGTTTQWIESTNDPATLIVIKDNGLAANEAEGYIQFAESGALKSYSAWLDVAAGIANGASVTQNVVQPMRPLLQSLRIAGGAAQGECIFTQ